MRQVVSALDPEWVEHYGKLDAKTREKVRAQYALWSGNPHHPSFEADDYESKRGPIYRVKLWGGMRAVARRDGDSYRWFFIGTHAEYDSYFGVKKTR